MTRRENTIRDSQTAATRAEADNARARRRQERSERVRGQGPAMGATAEADLGLTNSMEDDLRRLGLLPDAGTPAELPQSGVRPERVRGRMHAKRRPRPTG